MRERVIRPSATNSEDVEWIAPACYYSRGSQTKKKTTSFTGTFYRNALVSTSQKALKYSNFESTTRPVAIIANVVSRQPSHHRIHCGGVPADHCASMWFDAVHNGRDRRWCFRSPLSHVVGVAALIKPPQ